MTWGGGGGTARLVPWCIAPLSAILPEALHRILGFPGLLPEPWKDTTVAPLLKGSKGSSQLGGYRPICISPRLRRALEGAAACRRVASMAQVLHARRYGFQAGRCGYGVLDTVLGCATLACRTDESRALGSTQCQSHQRGACLAAYLDPSDALYRVPHTRLIEVLRCRHVPRCIARFARYWLYGRGASTMVSGRRSAASVLAAGVPHGARLHCVT
ncbi:endonuclease/reverse transcriptase [Leptomonas seymouri]|uniref:Endonuclease/reverse transcriptase n=1 Tax=Leptomonas seymouri TaxID=5684 RepID=A0A0N0P287_LEPSE|nr:endonuclease/reverse transcriptase [Leptomonas seymouri]|eukprot:KPI82666.1 endonuclease/reverse transcriptase [Leptomonas seymouri]